MPGRWRIGGDRDGRPARPSTVEFRIVETTAETVENRRKPYGAHASQHQPHGAHASQHQLASHQLTSMANSEDAKWAPDNGGLKTRKVFAEKYASSFGLGMCPVEAAPTVNPGHLNRTRCAGVDWG